ncbi:efflux RND transporter periplasmic adaptor subunit [Chondrinema litorale]|uniref:efflux RND transporter periplasmic adaptor subunit n=1 Tax=Chondrinema litorale TaxID=2994555 RepID=UPI002543F545|nr:efflux RND transporter periplasmic adaptor subunit [Chondrinema litorale]UZR98663.1 efflux RND transporter periplasmic adaptor subunit [Chondrinema litorale]
MRRIYQITFLFFTLSAFPSLMQSCTTEHAKGEGIEKKTEIPGIPAFSLTKNNLSTSIRIPGELIAFQQVDLYAKVSSFINKLHVDIGSEVKKGDLLASMDAPEINSQLAAAESRLKSQEAIYLASKATYNRLLETSKTPGTISPNDLEMADAKQKSDMAQLEAAKAAHYEIMANKDYLEIRAPFNGIITARNVSAGAYVGPTGKGSDSPIFTLQQQDKLRLVISVPEQYIGYLKNQDEVNFTVRSYPNETFTAKVARLAGALDSRLRSQRTEMDVVNPDKRLLPGMVAEVSIPLVSNEPSFVVPSTAVLNSTEGVFVIKVKDEKSVWVPVSLGQNGEGKTEVFGDLSEGDTIILNATEEIRNNGAVSKVDLS